VSEGAAKKEDKPRKFQAIRGTRDLLPPETALWNRVEQTAREVFATFGFGEIRLPIVEEVELFARAVGQETDIVNKEMCTFPNPMRFSEFYRRLRESVSKGTSEMGSLADLLPESEMISLRPEATAGVCRAYIEHNMQQLPQPVKLYIMGPMFRWERPQKGRYRQFYQIDAEVLGGSDAPAIDAELIEMVMTFFKCLGLEGVELHINSIGDKKCRPKYVELLRAELSKVKEKLGPDSQRRIDTNPLRVLDSKLESEQKLIEAMPHIADHLCEECAENYRGVKKELELRGVQYRENWRLVRGLDYYSRTTFEITAKGLGSQNAVCGGGRYDGLMELLGGPPTRATGFAIGEDRLILSLQESDKGVASGEWRVASEKPRVEVYIAWMGEKARATAIRAAKNLRAAGLSVELPPAEQKLGKALGQADKLGARFALILGDNELSSGEWTLKTLADGTQQKLSEPDLLNFLEREKAKADPSLRSG
jgi:histidyl-tRNA synthetase